jgi:cytidine deaminase
LRGTWSTIGIEARREIKRLFEPLIEAAILVRQNAYAPYSRFAVGAAILGADGRVYAGCNVENASLGLTICAERNAVAAMIAGGCRSISAVVVVLEGAGSPCGACRQVLAEFGDLFPVLLVDATSRTATRQWAIGELLPAAFRLAHPRLPE